MSSTTLERSTCLEVRCLACGYRWRGRNGDDDRCVCGRSTATFSEDVVELQGPAVARWHGPEGITTNAGTQGPAPGPWPPLAPRVRRRAIPPLL